MFLNAFARIYNTKVVIHNSGIDTANTAIGCNFDDIIHLYKNADHFNLMELPGRHVITQKLRGSDIYRCWGERNLYQWRVGMLFTILKVILFTYKSGCTLSASIFARI